MSVVPSYFISVGSCGVFVLSGKLSGGTPCLLMVLVNGVWLWVSVLLGDIKRLGERHGRRPGVFAHFYGAY